jgi:hypothetical protein
MRLLCCHRPASRPLSWDRQGSSRLCLPRNRSGIHWESRQQSEASLRARTCRTLLRDSALRSSCRRRRDRYPGDRCTRKRRSARSAIERLEKTSRDRRRRRGGSAMAIGEEPLVLYRDDAGLGAMGHRNRKVAPSPGGDVTHTRPRCPSTIFFTSASPIPLPSMSSCDLSRWKRFQMRS